MNDKHATIADGLPAGSLKAFAVETRGDDFSNTLKERISHYLTDFGLTYNDKHPDIVISVGGDGTLLQAFHRYVHSLSSTTFVGVHTGHLGFYADWTSDEVEKLVISIARDRCSIVQYPLLRINISYLNGSPDNSWLALNECTVRAYDGLLVADVLIRGEKFESFRGDGLCFSTPTGSTAYNKGLSGAIIHPSLASIQLAEIASINNRVYRTIGSPLILPRHHQCQVEPVGEQRFNLTIDHLSSEHDNVRRIEFSVADEMIRFARFRPFPFWRRVRDSFIG
ncbi:NAD kinase [Sporolactobacillus sp. Y61]|uniref:NAD kinase n=1 Tax=Sporolactobacillus sp. Y61 TaxID=3160863 RepID=A0AAU8ICA6_9BACL|nr:NAD kinase [Sporolactobacillus sp. THM19-2]RYL90272.1 NAD kinase [Sporolactobacillus sp. THM19-2]